MHLLKAKLQETLSNENGIILFGSQKTPKKLQNSINNAQHNSAKHQKLTTMASMASTSFSMLSWAGGNRGANGKRQQPFFISAQQTDVQQEQKVNLQEEQQVKVEPEQTKAPPKTQEPQVMARSKNMSREYGGQWLSSTTRHVRIYAAYIDPVTNAFDQTQMDKLTLILDPTNEFLWTTDTCNKVYTYFQELIDHYEGAPLTEYTLRLIGSDIEHYIRKLLYDGEIRYNMNARVLNFSMGKPRIIFNNNNPDGELRLS